MAWQVITNILVSQAVTFTFHDILLSKFLFCQFVSISVLSRVLFCQNLSSIEYSEEKLNKEKGNWSTNHMDILNIFVGLQIHNNTCLSACWSHIFFPLAMSLIHLPKAAWLSTYLVNKPINLANSLKHIIPFHF